MSKRDSISSLEYLKDTVFVTATLGYRYPQVFWPLKINLEVAGVKVQVIHGTSNIWIRDYFPVITKSGLAKFNYKGYPRFPQLSISNCPWKVLQTWSDFPITLDGGNVVRQNDRVVMTDKVIKDNNLSVLERLEDILEAEIILVPMEPGDELGHSDGIVKFIDDKNILINDYAGTAKRDKKFLVYQDRLYKLLIQKGLNVHLLHNAYHEWDWDLTEEQFRKCFPDADDFNPGFGYYINFLKVKKTILLPAMKLEMDTKAFLTIKHFFPNHRIVMIDCSSLSMEGGLLNCVTWSL